MLLDTRCVKNPGVLQRNICVKLQFCSHKIAICKVLDFSPHARAYVFHFVLFFHFMGTIILLMSSEEVDIKVTLLHGTPGNLQRRMYTGLWDFVAA